MRGLPLEVFTRLRHRLERLYGERAERCLDRLAMMMGRYGVGLGPRPERRGWTEADTLLITYGDMVRREGEPPLRTLRAFAEARLAEAIGTVHLLPFFPSTSDDGFSVQDYRRVDPALGGWKDVEALCPRFSLMFDLVLNHVSSRSVWFQDYLRGVAPGRDFFIEVDPGTDLSAVVRPRSLPLLRTVQTPSGERHVWTTFSADQIDVAFRNPDVLFEFIDILLLYISCGARIVRLDAIAYLWKEIGTPCIHHPNTHEVVKLLREFLDVVAPDVLLLTETNVPHEENVSYFGHGDEAHMVYQFSLPPLVLHALHSGSGRFLTEWARSLAMPPSGCTFLNFTASHDGVGLRPLQGLLPDAEFERLLDDMKQRGGFVSTKRNADGTESPYELNIAYFDALGDGGENATSLQIDRFLCSQTIALALQGVPAVYFHSLTGTRNDIEAVGRTGHPRAINRRKWDADELEWLLNDPSSPEHKVFHRMVERLRVRRAQPAFHPDGGQRILNLGEGVFALRRTALGGEQDVIGLHSLRDGPQRIDLTSTLRAVGSDAQWRELLAGVDLADAPSVVELGPYQCLWYAAT